MTRIILGIVSCLMLIIPSSFAAIPTLDELWSINFDNVTANTTRSYIKNNVHVEELCYESRPYQGSPVKIFAYYLRPKYYSGKLPGVLLVHGGGGTAKLSSSLDWAKHGYAVLAIDLPGKGYQRGLSRSTGPNMDVPVLLSTKPDIANNYLVHAVAASRYGITYLCNRPEVDKDRIGMVGLSWGGVITLLTNGQDKRLKTAVNVFGSGYIPEGCTWQNRFYNMNREQFSLWDKLIDPKNFLKTQNAPILFMTGTNDHCYYLPPFQKSFEDVTAYKKLLIIPNLKHQFYPYMQSMVWNWLDNYLKPGKCQIFPEICFLPVQDRINGKIIVPVTVDPINKIKKVVLYYSKGGPNGWTKKQWQSIAPYEEEGIYYFAIPTNIIRPEIMFFVNAKDNKGSTASSPIKSLFRLVSTDSRKSFAMTSPIQRIDVHQQPIQFFGSINVPDYAKLFFSEQFQAYQLMSLN